MVHVKRWHALAHRAAELSSPGAYRPRGKRSRGVPEPTNPQCPLESMTWLFRRSLFPFGSGRYYRELTSQAGEAPIATNPQCPLESMTWLFSTLSIPVSKWPLLSGGNKSSGESADRNEPTMSFRINDIDFRIPPYSRFEVAPTLGKQGSNGTRRSQRTHNVL